MADDIQPLTPMTSTPLVREKRHYPGEQEQQAQQYKKQQKKKSSDEAEVAKETSDDLSKKLVDIDEKNATVRHIDEYA